MGAGRTGRAWRPGLARGLGWGLALWLVVSLGAPAQAQVEREFETYLMQQLAKVQQGPVPPQPFVSDGCSGGLSDIWRGLARALPGFEEEYGAQPPWEHCCVAHDRAYWRGEAENGYERRKAADLRLKQCVIDTGRGLRLWQVAGSPADAPELAQRFRLAADLMYRAVRAGGLPCTPLPWRWGYGWPPCPLLEE